MKLIEKGNKKHGRFVGTCRDCGSKFEADRTELKIEPGDQREPGEFAWHKCSECGTGPYGGILFYPAKGNK